MDSFLAGTPERAEDRVFVCKATNIVEALYNLTYLICEEADHPERVRQYAGMSEERLRAMAELLMQESPQ
jgi:hypothetical protein